MFKEFFYILKLVTSSCVEDVPNTFDKASDDIDVVHEKVEKKLQRLFSTKAAKVQSGYN